jgi:ABC-type transporter Mla subunit MlaD
MLQETSLRLRLALFSLLLGVGVGCLILGWVDLSGISSRYSGRRPQITADESARLAELGERLAQSGVGIQERAASMAELSGRLVEQSGNAVDRLQRSIDLLSEIRQLSAQLEDLVGDINSGVALIDNISDNYEVETDSDIEVGGTVKSSPSAVAPHKARAVKQALP